MNKKEKFIVIIPAQDCSIRLKGKNLRNINGKTLIEYAIDYAMESQYVDKIVVSTNSEEVKHICNQKYNQKYKSVDVFGRPDCMCGDTDVVNVYKFVIKEQLPLFSLPPENKIYIIGIQPDNPDRSTKLDTIIKYCLDKQYEDCLTVGNDGHRNGSVRVMEFNSLYNDKIGSVKIGVTIDNCTNIHSERDLRRATHSLSKKTIELSGGVSIGNQKTFIIAEAACNHMCSMNLAQRMILDAKIAGADAIKFQTYKAETHVTKDAVSYWGDKPIKQIDYYKNLDKFGIEQYKELFSFAYEIGIIPFSTPFDVDSAIMLNYLGMELFKIPSMAINDLDLLKTISSFGKPIILSTGGSNLQEIDRAIDIIFEAGNYKLVLLACNLSYPTQNKDANLNRIKTLKNIYQNFIIGYSDHTFPDTNMVIPSLAVAMGAKVIEKHYTLDKLATGSGQFFSSDVDDFKKIVQNIRLCENVMGDGKIEVLESEISAVNGSRKSIVIFKDVINEGTVLTKDMLIGKRPGNGIPIDKIGEVIGKKTKKVLYYDDMFKWEDIE